MVSLLRYSKRVRIFSLLLLLSSPVVSWAVDSEEANSMVDTANSGVEEAYLAVVEG
jgi:hypothetical protein